MGTKSGTKYKRALSRPLVPPLWASDIRAALARARIILDFPQADASVKAPPTVTPIEKPEPKPKPTSETPGDRKVAARYDVTLKQLLDAGLIQPGTQLRQRYLGRDVSATVESDGRVRVGDEVFESLSIAGGAARVNVKGPPPDGRRYYQTNGWTFWEYEDASGKRQPIETLRKQYLSGR